MTWSASARKQFDTDTSEHLFKLTTSYHFQGPLEKLRVGGNVSWQSRMYNDIPLANGFPGQIQHASLKANNLDNAVVAIQRRAGPLFYYFYLLGRQIVAKAKVFRF